MPQITVECSHCGSDEYELISGITGEVRCPYCHSQWIVPALGVDRNCENPLEIKTRRGKEPSIILDKLSFSEYEQMAESSGFELY